MSLQVYGEALGGQQVYSEQRPVRNINVIIKIRGENKFN